MARDLSHLGRDPDGLGQAEEQIRVHSRSSMVFEFEKGRSCLRDCNRRDNRPVAFDDTSKIDCETRSLGPFSDYREPFELSVNLETILQIHAQRSLVVRFRPWDLSESRFSVSRRICFSNSQSLPAEQVASRIEKCCGYTLPSMFGSYEEAHYGPDRLRRVCHRYFVRSHVDE